MSQKEFKQKHLFFSVVLWMKYGIIRKANSECICILHSDTTFFEFGVVPVPPTFTAKHCGQCPKEYVCRKKAVK